MEDVVKESIEIVFSNDKNGVANSENKASHRYFYRKVFNTNLNDKMLTFIMLNPSNADQNKPDQTIKNIEEITIKNKSKGYNGFQIVNLFSYRTPSQKCLIDKIERLKISQDDSFNEKNFKYLKDIKGDVVLAWGSKAKSICNKYKKEYYNKLLFLLNDKCNKNDINIYTYASSLNKDGSPKHPGAMSYNRLNNDKKELKKLKINEKGESSYVLSLNES